MLCPKCQENESISSDESRCRKCRAADGMVAAAEAMLKSEDDYDHIHIIGIAVIPLGPNIPFSDN